MPTADFDDSFINWPDDPPSLSLSLPLSSRPHPSVHPAIVDLGLQSAAPVLKYEQNPLQSSLAHGGIDYRPAHAYHHSAMPDLSHANFMRASMDAIGPNPYASASSGDGHYGLVMGDGAGGGGGMHAGGAWHSDQSDSSASLSAQLYTTSPSSSARPSAALQAGKTEASLQFVREHALSLLAHGPEVLTRYHGIEVHLPDASSSMPLDDDTAADSNEHLGPGAGECKVQIVPGAYIRSPGCITLLAETWMRPDKCTHDFLISGSQTGVELHYPIHEVCSYSLVAPEEVITDLLNSSCSTLSWQTCRRPLRCTTRRTRR